MAKNVKVSTYLEVLRQGSILPPVLFSMVMDEIIRKVTEGQESGLQNIIV
jgi:hypothetical protein